MPVAPAPASSLKCTLSPFGPWTCFEPENIMCSNKCAKPVRPGASFAGPTWYQRFTATMGKRWSSLTMTVSPFGNLKVSYFSVGMPEAEGAVLAAADDDFAGAVADFCPAGTAVDFLAGAAVCA